MDTDAGFSRKSETIKGQRAACTRPEQRKIECKDKIHGAWNVCGTEGGQKIRASCEGFRLAFKAWSGFR